MDPKIQDASGRLETGNDTVSNQAKLIHAGSHIKKR